MNLYKILLRCLKLFRREKEKELDKETYMKYMSDDNTKAELIGSWYKEFVEK